MSSSSVRKHAARAIHQHEEPPEEDGRVAIPDSRCEEGNDAAGDAASARLWREGDRVLYRDASMEKPEAVRVLWARPLSGREGPVSVMLATKKKEVAYLPSLDVLDEASKAVAREELAASMVLPRITEIYRVKPRFGNYYWDVETDKGRRKFLLSSPENNTYRPRPDVIVVKDVSGNCYEIAPVSGLDRNSLREMDRVL